MASQEIANNSRKDYYRQYYSNRVKPKREEEKKALELLPLLRQDLAAERVLNQLQAKEIADLRDHVLRLETELEQAKTEADKLGQFIIMKQLHSVFPN